MNRRTVAALCLITSPAVHLISYFLWPSGSEGSAAAQLAAAGSHPGSMAAAAIIDSLGWVLLLPALVVLWTEIRGRGATLVGIGVWGAVLGVLAYTAGEVLNLVTIALSRAPQGLAAFTAVRSYAVITAVVVVPILLGELALVALLAGLARAGLGGWWMPVAGFVAVAADQVLSESENALLLSAAFLPMAVPLALIGVRLLSARTAPQLTRAPVPAAA